MNLKQRVMAIRFVFEKTLQLQSIYYLSTSCLHTYLLSFDVSNTIVKSDIINYIASVFVALCLWAKEHPKTIAPFFILLQVFCWYFDELDVTSLPPVLIVQKQLASSNNVPRQWMRIIFETSRIFEEFLYFPYRSEAHGWRHNITRYVHGKLYYNCSEESVMTFYLYIPTSNG